MQTFFFYFADLHQCLYYRYRYVAQTGYEASSVSGRKINLYRYIYILGEFVMT